MIPLLLSLIIGQTYLAPNDPNFIEDYMRCYFSPTCNPVMYDQFVQRWEWEHWVEPEEPNVPEIVGPPLPPEPNYIPVKWGDIPEIKKVRLLAMIEHWGFGKTKKSLLPKPIPFSPRASEIYVSFKAERLLNIQDMISIEVWMDPNQFYWVDQFLIQHDWSDLNKDGIVNWIDYNILVKGE